MALIDVVRAEYGEAHLYEVGAEGQLAYRLEVTPPNVVASSARAELPVPAGAIIDVARFEVVVDPPGRSRIGDVAEVRSVAPSRGSSTELIVDFKTMQTVSEIEMPTGLGLTGLFPWLGTRFGDIGEQILPAGAGARLRTGLPSMAFQEVLTEKLLCMLDSATRPEDLESGEVVIPSPPSFVEILINGTRAWFSPIGPAAPRQHEKIAGVHAFADVVDLTEALQLALDAERALSIELRVSSPAQLQFSAERLQIYRTHEVRFSEGPTRGFDALDEGRYEIDLPLPDEVATESWDVHAVELNLRADIDETRVRPAIGPPLAADIGLTLAESRTLLVKLPSSLVSLFGEITGVRVPVRAGVAGGELAGELLHDDTSTGASRPGEAVDGGVLRPAEVPASTDLAYLTLWLETPFEPAADASDALWCTLRSTRGEVTWALGLPEPDDALSDAEVRWRAPNGAARSLSEFSVPGDTGTTSHAGAIRLVGTRDPNRPLDAVKVGLGGGTASVSLTPFETGSPIRLALEDPISPGPARSLPLDLVVSAPGSYTIDSARVIYTDPALDEPFVEEGGT